LAQVKPTEDRGELTRQHPARTDVQIHTNNNSSAPAQTLIRTQHARTYNGNTRAYTENKRRTHANRDGERANHDRTNANGAGSAEGKRTRRRPKEAQGVTARLFRGSKLQGGALVKLSTTRRSQAPASSTTRMTGETGEVETDGSAREKAVNQGQESADDESMRATPGECGKSVLSNARG
jgi:hypothetical protein